jgi:putative nucleotidyltransferase with HDIG domain
MALCPYCETPVESLPGRCEIPVLDACTACMNPFVRYQEGVEQLTRPAKGVRDIRETAQGESIGAVILKNLTSAIERIPMLPEIAQQVLAMTSDPEVSMQDMAEIITQDPVLAGKILQVSNSALYGGLTEIKDLQAACARLGMKNICNTVQTIAGGNMFSISNPEYRDMLRKVWHHALASAHGASQLAIQLAEPHAEILFAAGLLHDIGKVALIDIIANDDAPAAEMLRGSAELLLEVLEGYHALIGLHIVKRWKLPAEFRVATYCHEHSAATPHEDWLPIVHIVALASEVAAATGFGFAADEDTSLINHASARYFGLNDIKLATLRVDVEDKVGKMTEIFAAA